MDTTNIQFDFTTTPSKHTNDGQPLAVMSADLAKKLLASYADNLIAMSPADIVRMHIKDLEDCIDTASPLGYAMETSVEWLQERDLIAAIVNRNWDAYAVEPPVSVNSTNMCPLSPITDSGEILLPD